MATDTLLRLLLFLASINVRLPGIARNRCVWLLRPFLCKHLLVNLDEFCRDVFPQVFLAQG